ncbi:MAG: hypothetical protein RLZZ455_1191 [Candidatus Parcubacteria bacterium]|jgi:uncharacterized protein YbjQ (UPF0145 family)
MLINPAIFILLVTAVLGLSAVILFIIQSYNHLIKKIEQAEREKLHLHDAVNQKATEILEHTHRQNTQVIEDVAKQAKELLSATQADKGSEADKLRNTLDALLIQQQKNTETMNDRFSKNYLEALEKLRNQDIKSFEKVSADAAEIATKEMQDFTKSLKGETIDAHAIMRERIEQEYAKAEEEIEKYKLEKLKMIDASVYPLLKNVVSLVVGKSLTQSDHESLVTQAIQDAAREITIKE